jgi:hypothetical protein
MHLEEGRGVYWSRMAQQWRAPVDTYEAISSIIMRAEFLDKLITYYLLKKESIECSKSAK